MRYFKVNGERFAIDDERLADRYAAEFEECDCKGKTLVFVSKQDAVIESMRNAGRAGRKPNPPLVREEAPAAEPTKPEAPKPEAKEGK